MEEGNFIPRILITLKNSNLFSSGIRFCELTSAEQITTMPKDRLAAMQQKAGGDDEDFAVPVDDEIEGSMATYLKDIEEIRSTCDKIDGKMKDVKKLQSEILSSPTVDAKMQSQMDDYMAEIKKLANTVRNK